MSFSRLVAPTSRPPPDGYVSSPTVASSLSSAQKEHVGIDLGKDPECQIHFQTRAEVVIAQLTPKELDAYQNLLFCPQSYAAWIAIYNDISRKFFEKPLFVGQEQDASFSSHDMTHAAFSEHYASKLSHDPALGFSVSHFFDYLKRRHDESID